MRIDDLALFRYVAQERNVSRAAALVELTQSAASQRINQLEAEIGSELLDRARRPLELTAAGKLVADFAQDVLRRRERLEAALAKLRATVDGPVRFAMIYSVGLSELAALREDYRRRYPQGELSVEYLRPEKIYEAVLTDGADLGVVSYPTRRREIAVIPWRQEEMVVAVAPEHPLASFPTLHPSQLNGLPFIAFDADLPIRRHIDRFLRQQRVAVKPLMHLDNLDSIREAVEQNAGVAIVPKPILRVHLEQQRLRAIPLVPKHPRRPLGIIHHKRKKFSPAARAFLELLRESSRR